MSDPQQQFPPAPGAQPPATASTPPQPSYGSAPAYQPAYPGTTAQNGYPAEVQSRVPPAPRAGRGADGSARVALVLAIVSVALGLASTLLTRFVLIQMVYQLRLSGAAVTGYNIASQGILLLVFAATLILGLLTIRSDRKLVAGIAIGVGGAGTINAIVSLIATAIASLL